MAQGSSGRRCRSKARVTTSTTSTSECSCASSTPPDSERMIPRSTARLLALALLAPTLAAAGVGLLRSTLVMCHNANCAGAPEPAADDRIASLTESLALRYAGKPLLDGVELDVFWHGASGRCLFAHDAEHSAGSAAAREAAELVADH